MEPEPRQHVRHTAIRPFGERHADHGTIRIVLDEGELHGLGARLAPHAALRPDGFTRQFGQVSFIRAAAHHGFVCSWNAVARMREFIGKLSVVGEQHQPGGVEVQSSDWEEPGLCRVRDKIKDGRAALPFRIQKRRIVTGRTQHACRFVDHDVHTALGLPQRPAVDVYLVNIGVNEYREFADHLAIDCDVSFFDQCFAFPARRDAGGRHHALQPHQPGFIGRGPVIEVTCRSRKGAWALGTGAASGLAWPIRLLHHLS